MSARARRVQNSRRRPAPRRAARARPPSKIRHQKHGGGRPLLFIPTAVVVEASRLFDSLRRWSDVLAALERGGNGTYARNTLIRRVLSWRVQNSPQVAAGGGRRRAARGASKTPPEMLDQAADRLRGELARGGY